MNIFDIYHWYNCNCPPGSPNFVKIISDWVSEKAFLYRIFELPIFKFFQKIIVKCQFYQERFKQIEPNWLLSPEFYVSRLLKIDCLGHGHLIWNRWRVCHTFARFVNFLFAQSESHYQHFGWAIFSWFRKSIVRWFLYLHLGIEPRDRKWSSGRISR